MIFLKEIGLANKIKNLKSGDCPYTLFLGAGASVSSGIPASESLVTYWKRKLYADLRERDSEFEGVTFEHWAMDQKNYNEEINKNPNNPKIKTTYIYWKNDNNFVSEPDYSLLFSTLHQTPRDRQLIIEQIIEDKKPAFGYLFLAGLIAAKRFNRVITTNFDDLLNDALFKFYSIKPIVCAFDSMVSGIRVDSQRPKIIKLHGDFLYDNIRNTRNELKSLDANIEDKMFEMCKDRGLIIVGYSGSDLSVMAPLNEMLRKKGFLEMGLHWCFLHNEVKDKKIPISLIELHQQYSDKVFFYEIRDFDNLMEKMFFECKCSLPAVLENPTNVNITKEFYETVIEDGKKRIVDLTHNQADCLRKFIRARKKSGGDDDLKLLADDYFAIGRKLREEAEGKEKTCPSKAKELYEKSMEEYQGCLSLLDDYLQRIPKLPVDSKNRKLFIYVKKRLSGLYIALGKVDYKLNGDVENYKQFLEKALTVKNEFFLNILPVLNEIELSDVLGDRQSFYNNSCCAISLLAEVNKKFNKEEADLIINYLKEDINYTGSMTHVKEKILKDEDMRFFIKSYKELIEKEFGS